MMGKDLTFRISTYQVVIGGLAVVAMLGLCVDQFFPGPWSQIAVILSLVACMFTLMRWLDRRLAALEHALAIDRLGAAPPHPLTCINANGSQPPPQGRSSTSPAWPRA